MTDQEVSNEQIYDLLKAQAQRLQVQEKRTDQLFEFLKEFKADFSQFKSDTHDNFSDTRADIRSLKRGQERLEDRTTSMEKKIDGIHISWNHKLIAGTIGTSAVISGIVAFAISTVS
ncbi:MAG: hypothetical protein ABW185_10840 [Sedimenticola sp.]